MEKPYNHSVSPGRNLSVSTASVCILIIFLTGSVLAQSGDLKSAATEQTPAKARIIVNVPAYKLAFYRGDKLVKTFPITIGSRDYSSPYGIERQAIELVWNPRWTPPPSDWARKDKPAAPGAANNPLGCLKIRLASFPFLIHGGGDRSINRPVSHGCVRLRNSDALQLARLVIDACQLSVSNKQIASFIADRHHEHGVPITAKVAVLFRYDTITVEEGRVCIYPDIYNEGTNTLENLIYVLYQAGVDFHRLSPEQQSSFTKALEKNSKRQDFQLPSVAETKLPERHNGTETR